VCDEPEEGGYTLDNTQLGLGSNSAVRDQPPSLIDIYEQEKAVIIIWILICIFFCA